VASNSRLRSAFGRLTVLAAGATWGALAARLLAETTLVRPWIDWPVHLVLVGLSAGAVTWGVGRWASPVVTLPLFLGLVYLAQPSTSLLQGWAVWGASVLLVALVSARRVPRRAGWLVPLAALGLYLTTMPTTVGAADTFEFQVTAHRMGVAHPTGYPLYVFLGWLFSRLPAGSVAWRVNLTSVCAAVATIGLVFALLWRLWDSNRTAAWVRAVGSGFAAVTLAVSPAFWSQAVAAEVYALNTLLVALLTWLVVQPPTDRYLWLVALVLGLGLSHHLTAVLLLPAMVVALAPALWERRGRPRFWLVGLGGFLLGLTPYLYLPLRWPAFHEGRLLSWPEFWSWVTGARFHGAFRLDTWLRDPSRYGIVARLLREQVGWVGLALAGLGLAWAVWKRPRLGVASLLAWGGYVFYALNYRVPDLAVFLLPAVLMLCLWLGSGALALARVVQVEGLRVVWLSAAVLLPLSLFWSQLPQADRRDEGQALEAWGRYALAQPLVPDAVVLADAEKFAPLYYLNQVEGVRPDLEVVLLPDEAAYQTELATRLARGQVVYLARYLPGLEATHHLRSVGPLVEVATAPQTKLPVGLDALQVEFGDQVRLSGARVEGSNPLRVTLAWQRIGPADALTTRLQVVDGTGEVWARVERVPVAGLYPTNAWKEGEVVTDYYEVVLDETTPPGDLVLEVGMGRPFAPQGLPVNGTQQDAFQVAHVVRSLADLPSTLQGRDRGDRTATLEARRVLFDGRLALIGVAMPSVVPANAPAQVRLYWSSSGSLPEYVLRLVPRCGSRETSAALQWGRLSTSEWPDDRVVITRHVLNLPSIAGPCEIELGLERGGDSVGWRPAWWPLEQQWHSLGQVQPEPESRAAFGGRMALVDARLDTAATVPGGLVQVSLIWRGLSPMVEDYTVFVQALGPDGQLYGQDDSWPVAGTFPTSQWNPGEVVLDTHRFVLRADAPPGQYRVIVGWYLLSTMGRLPVRDVGGRDVADFVEVDVLNVAE
jgi:hypothetical protein